MSKANSTSGFSSISRWETPHLHRSKSDSEHLVETAEEIKRAAFEEGQKLGYEAGLAQAAKKTSQRISVADAYLHALTRPFEEQNEEIAELMAQLAGKIAKSLVRRELRTEPETIMALVRDTVAALNTTTKDITIHLNPENAGIIRELIRAESQESNWSIVDDPLVTRCDCKVSSHDSLIDADLQSRIDTIIIQFLGDERSEARK